MNITLLIPTWDQAIVSKKFTLTPDKKPALLSAYNLGKKFKHRTTDLKNIKELYHVLDKCKDKPVIRIYGKPIDGLSSISPRQKEFFECDTTDLLLIDIDGWELPPEYKLRKKEDIGKAVSYLLVEKLKYAFFKDVQCVVLLSSSMWGGSSLRAHVYFQLSRPFKLQELSSWAVQHNLLHPDYKIDSSMFREVQPDFIAKRECIGFKDPLPDDARLTFQCDNGSPTINGADFAEALKRVSEKLNNLDPRLRGSATNSLVSVPIGDNWTETLKLCGSSTYGINEPAYRGCAQLVQEVGSHTVKKELHRYVDKVHQIVWTAIKKYGVRGDKNDRTNYNKAKFENYLKTAIDKDFGAGADADYVKILDAIESVFLGHSVNAIFDRDVSESLKNLRKKDKAKFAEVRSKVKNDLRGKLSVKDFDTLSRLEEEDLDNAQKIELVIENLEWIKASNTGAKFCKVNNGDHYQLVPITAGVDKFIFEVALGLGINNVYKGFEVDVVKLVLARENNPLYSPFKQRVVETRCYTDVNKNGEWITYYNLGVSVDEDMRTAVIDKDGIRIIPAKEAPILWYNPQKQGYAIVEPDLELENLVGKDYRDVAVGAMLLQFRKFVAASSIMDLFDLVSWMVTVIINNGTLGMLELLGPSGSGKTTLALLIKDLCDPARGDMVTNPEVHNTLYRKDDLAKTLNGGQITIFDNFSNLPPADQNTLCTIATGWTWEERVMYSQDRVSHSVKKPIIITGLDTLATNQDLRSRTTTVEIDDTRRSNCANLFEEWADVSSQIREGLLCLTSLVLKEVKFCIDTGLSVNSRTLIGDLTKLVMMRRSKVFRKRQRSELMNTVLHRRMERDATEALTNGLTSKLVMWVMYSKLFRAEVVGAGSPTTISSHVLLQDFTKFLNENSGHEFYVRGEKITLTMDGTEFNLRKFGKALSCHVRDIHAATAWTVRKSRQGATRGWAFKVDKVHLKYLMSMYPATPDPFKR